MSDTPQASSPEQLMGLRVWIALPLIALLASVASLLAGAGSLADETLRNTLLELRLWRTLTAFSAGGALALAGVLVQGIFMNPLASPSILGTTAGAALGGQLALLATTALLGSFGATLISPEMLVPFGCVAGAIGALFLLLALTRNQSSMMVTLLIGFLLSSLFLSVGTFLTSLAQESWELGRAVLSFTLGSIAGVGSRQAALMSATLIVGTLAALTWAARLDVLISGEEEAAALGVPVQQVRRWCIIWAALLSAIAVAVGGNVAFVGLIIPHLLRPLLGSSAGRLMPACVVAGGSFLVICDTLTRTLPSRSEIPLGVITGLIGAPLFLFLLLRAARQEAGHA